MKPWTSDKKWADGHDCLFTSIDFQGGIFGRRGHQPFSRPMSTLLFVMWLIVNLLSFGRCGHQPVSRPMSTLLFCYVSDCQFVACLGACPSAHFLSDVHVAICYVSDCQFVACLGACPSAHFLSDVHEARLCDNRVVYGLLRIEHTTHAIQPSGEITRSKTPM